MRTIITRALLATGAACLVLAAGVEPMAATAVPMATAAGGLGLSPANASASGPTYFVLHVKPGQSSKATVLVTNSSSRAMSLTVRAVDGLTGQTSGTIFAGQHSRVRKAGAWVRPSVRSLTVPAHATRLVPFTVRVPAKSEPGDHVAGIAFQNRLVTSSKKKKFTIKEIVRNVIAVQIVVPGHAAFHPRLTTMRIGKVGATNIAAVFVGLGDRGRKLGAPTLAVTLVGPKQQRRRLVRQLDTLLPGDTIHYPFTWPVRIRPGTYHVVAVLRGGGEHVTLRRTLRVRNGASAAKQREAAFAVPHQDGTQPWQLVLLVGAGLGIAVTTSWLARRRMTTGRRVRPE